MSEGTTPEVPEQEASASKRKTLSLSDRFKVVDYLRSQPEPIVGDSSAAIAIHVSTATGVDINWAQLKYMLDELTEMKLSAKVHVRTLLTTEDERMAALEAKVEGMSQDVAKLTDLFVKLSDRVLHVESNLQP